jgi:hypothetical protein
MVRIVLFALGLSSAFLMCELLLIACGVTALCVLFFLVGAASLSSHLTSADCRSKDVHLLAVIIAELELGDMEGQVLFAGLVESVRIF